MGSCTLFIWFRCHEIEVTFHLYTKLSHVNTNCLPGLFSQYFPPCCLFVDMYTCLSRLSLDVCQYKVHLPTATLWSYTITQNKHRNQFWTSFNTSCAIHYIVNMSAEKLCKSSFFMLIQINHFPPTSINKYLAHI